MIRKRLCSVMIIFFVTLSPLVFSIQTRTTISPNPLVNYAVIIAGAHTLLQQTYDTTYFVK